MCIHKNTYLFTNYGKVKISLVDKTKVHAVTFSEEDDPKLDFNPIRELVFVGRKPCVKLELSNGFQLCCTPDHRVYSRSFHATSPTFKRVSNLRLGDEVGTVVGGLGFSTLESVEQIGIHEIYSVEIEGNRHFVANGIIGLSL
jgi:hypothetical protein